MRTGFRIAVSLALCLALVACGRGVDKTLSRDSDWDYHRSLDDAFKDMKPEQQQAYNWAVSNLTLDQLLAKYHTLTPRKVIEQEADETIQAGKQNIENQTASYEKDAPQLKLAYDRSKVLGAELEKINGSNGAIVKVPPFDSKGVQFKIQNGSRFGISFVSWNVSVFLNGETSSERGCSLDSVFLNGLPAGGSTVYTYDLFASGSDCAGLLNTPEVLRAKSISLQFAPSISSVEDFNRNEIYVPSPTEAQDFQNAVKADKDAVAAAEDAKASIQ